MKEKRKFSIGWFIFWGIILFPIGFVIYPVYYIARVQEEK